MNRNRLFVLACASFALLAVASSALASGQKWKTYRCSDFAVKYPPTFKVAKGRDGVSFRSPNGLVELYAYTSWLGRDNYTYDYELDPRKEIRTSFVHELVGRGVRDTVSIRAIDGSYYRRYLDERNPYTRSAVFGFKYKNLAAFNKYKAVFRRFMTGLVNSPLQDGR